MPRRLHNEGNLARFESFDPRTSFDRISPPMKDANSRLNLNSGSEVDDQLRSFDFTCGARPEALQLPRLQLNHAGASAVVKATT